MTISVDLNECFTRRKNEASHGKATFFLGYKPQNFNFVRFGSQLDKILSHIQRIGAANKILNSSNNKLMSSLLQITALNRTKTDRDYSNLFALKEQYILSAFSVSSLFIKKIQNKEV